LRPIPRECNTGIQLLQRLAFLHPASLRLCPVFFDGEMILPGEGPDDAAAKVATLLAGSHSCDPPCNLGSSPLSYRAILISRPVEFP
jgi:hypothetical protein